MPTLTLAGHVVPLLVRRSAAARRMTLSTCAVRRHVALTLPRRVALRDGLAFVEARRDWLQAQATRWPARHALGDGATLPFRGATLTIRHTLARRATGRDGDALWVGGDAAALPGRVARWLRAQALATLTAETRAMAARIGRPVAGVAVGDPARRWGSCASTGAIRYSWRLILAPDWLWRAVVAHEVAHLAHPNHGADFWALATELGGTPPGDVRAWLRDHGAELHAVGR